MNFIILSNEMVCKLLLVSVIASGAWFTAPKETPIMKFQSKVMSIALDVIRLKIHFLQLFPNRCSDWSVEGGEVMSSSDETAVIEVSCCIAMVVVEKL